MMSWSDISAWLLWAVAGVATGIVVLVRRIFTNEKQIELLKQEMLNREKYRIETDARIASQLLEMRTDIKTLMRFNDRHE